MPIRNFRPTSPGQRFQTVQVFDEITTQEPHKPLVEPLHQSGGRNNAGQLTSWWRGGVRLRCSVLWPPTASPPAAGAAAGGRR